MRNDVLIVHGPGDSELALGVLLVTLEHQFSYKCGSKQLPRDLTTCKPNTQFTANLR